MSSTARVELRVEPSAKALWVQAAEFSNLSLTEFIEGAARSKAEEVLKRKPRTLGRYKDDPKFNLHPGWDAPLECMSEYMP